MGDLLEKALMPSTLEELSTLLALLMILIPSLSLRSRRSRTAVLLCSPCSDSTSRLLPPERDLLRTGLSTSPTLLVSTVLPAPSPPSSLLRVSWSETYPCLIHPQHPFFFVFAMK